MNRRTLLKAALPSLAFSITPIAWSGARTTLEVWKDPSCGCCKDWIKHVEANGFEVRTFDTGNTAARSRLGMPVTYGSCHTVRAGNYVIEGHVPAREIHRLLKEKPAGIGLAVPGMPVGSPGMDGPAYGNRQKPYDVLLILADGSSRIFETYR